MSAAYPPGIEQLPPGQRAACLDKYSDLLQMLDSVTTIVFLHGFAFVVALLAACCVTITLLRVRNTRLILLAFSCVTNIANAIFIVITLAHYQALDIVRLAFFFLITAVGVYGVLSATCARLVYTLVTRKRRRRVVLALTYTVLTLLCIGVMTYCCVHTLRLDVFPKRFSKSILILAFVSSTSGAFLNIISLIVNIAQHLRKTSILRNPFVAEIIETEAAAVAAAGGGGGGNNATISTEDRTKTIVNKDENLSTSATTAIDTSVAISRKATATGSEQSDVGSIRHALDITKRVLQAPLLPFLVVNILAFTSMFIITLVQDENNFVLAIGALVVGVVTLSEFMIEFQPLIYDFILRRGDQATNHNVGRESLHRGRDYQARLNVSDRQQQSTMGLDTTTQAAVTAYYNSDDTEVEEEHDDDDGNNTNSSSSGGGGRGGGGGDSSMDSTEAKIGRCGIEEGSMKPIMGNNNRKQSMMGKGNKDMFSGQMKFREIVGSNGVGMTTASVDDSSGTIAVSTDASSLRRKGRGGVGLRESRGLIEEGDLGAINTGETTTETTQTRTSNSRRSIKDSSSNISNSGSRGSSRSSRSGWEAGRSPSRSTTTATAAAATAA